MLTPSMIEAEEYSTPLTEDQKLNLQLLVRGAYPQATDLWDTQLETYLDSEIATPTVRTKSLKAVLTQLDALPAEDVESQGDSDSPTFFSTSQNWKALALDVLNVFKIRVMLGHQSWGIQQRKLADLTLVDANIIGQAVPVLKG